MAKSERGIPARQIVQERVSLLLKLAGKTETGSSLETRYVFLARELSMKYRVRLTKNQRRSFCKECNTPLIPGRNLRVRIQHGKVIYTCETCGAVVRIPIHQKKNQ